MRKSQLAAGQASKGCWNPFKKNDIPYPRTKKNPQQNGNRGTITLESSPIPMRDSWRAQTKPCVNQDPGEENSEPQQETGVELPVNV